MQSQFRVYNNGMDFIRKELILSIFNIFLTFFNPHFII